MNASEELVVVHVAPNPADAELALSVLRSEGIKCGTRASNRAAGAGDGLASWGPQEVLVRANDAEAARQLLRDPDASQVSPARPLPS